MNENALQFGRIRKYCSVINRISICMYETGGYENFDRIALVPHTYDDLYLYGFGIIDSEFPSEEGWDMKVCMEIVLSRTPRADLK